MPNHTREGFNRIKFGALCAAILAAGAAPAYADITFNPASYTGWTTGTYGTGGGTASVSILNSGTTLGITTNSAPGRSVGYAFDPANGSTGTPLAGSTLDFSLHVSNVLAFGNGQQIYLALAQNGNVYLDHLGPTLIGPSPPAYYLVTFTQTGLTPSDFALVSGAGPALPDLSGGATSFFGFGGGNVGSSTITQNYGLPSFGLQTVAVPEPASLSLVLVSCAMTGLAACRRRTRRQSAIV